MRKFLLTFVLLLAVPCMGQVRQGMRPVDVLRVANVTDAQISPNGQWVVYSVSSVEEDKAISSLWLVRPGLDSYSFPNPIPTPTPRRPMPYTEWTEIRSTPRPLLPPGWNASHPRWSPDSNSIAFLSHHDEQDGLWIVKLDKPEPRFLAPITSTNFFITYAGESLSWSPDSKRIAYISAKAETSEPKTGDPHVIDRIQYKSRTSLSDNRRTHVWVVDVERPMAQQLA